jgi:hypothetical protein
VGVEAVVVKPDEDGHQEGVSSNKPSTWKGTATTRHGTYAGRGEMRSKNLSTFYSFLSGQTQAEVK